MTLGAGRMSYKYSDFVKCLDNEPDTNACSFLKLPHSHAFVLKNGSFQTAHGLYNIENGNPWEDQDFDQDFYFEFGRTYTVRAPTGTRHDEVLEGAFLHDRR